MNWRQDQEECNMSTAEITTVYENISRALSRLDLEAALSYFADSEDMVKISNGHVLRGKQELADYWQGRLGAVRELKVTIENVEIHALGDHHLWATADETISVEGNAQKAIVSNIFIHTGQGWKILLDHTTYLP
jgi:ketosteroid isomerase-like protein